MKIIQRICLTTYLFHHFYRQARNSKICGENYSTTTGLTNAEEESRRQFLTFYNDKKDKNTNFGSNSIKGKHSASKMHLKNGSTEKPRTRNGQMQERKTIDIMKDIGKKTANLHSSLHSNHKSSEMNSRATAKAQKTGETQNPYGIETNGRTSTKDHSDIKTVKSPNNTGGHSHKHHGEGVGPGSILHTNSSQYSYAQKTKETHTEDKSNTSIHKHINLNPTFLPNDASQSSAHTHTLQPSISSHPTPHSTHLTHQHPPHTHTHGHPHAHAHAQQHTHTHTHAQAQAHGHAHNQQMYAPNTHQPNSHSLRCQPISRNEGDRDPQLKSFIQQQSAQMHNNNHSFLNYCKNKSTTKVSLLFSFILCVDSEIQCWL